MTATREGREGRPGIDLSASISWNGTLSLTLCDVDLTLRLTGISIRSRAGDGGGVRENGSRHIASAHGLDAAPDYTITRTIERPWSSSAGTIALNRHEARRL